MFQSIVFVSRRAMACLVGAAGMAAVAAVGGCSSPGFNPGPSRAVEHRQQAFPIDHAAYSKVGYRLDWIGFPMVTGSLPVQHVQAAPDMVATLEQGTTLSILEPNTGARRCATQLSNPLTRFVGMTIDGNRIHACSDTEVFTVDAQTCNLVGRTRIEKIVSTPPVPYGNLLIFGTGSGEILAHMVVGTVGGVKAWGFLSNGAFEQPPVLVGSAVGGVSQAGQVVFLDAGSGSLLGTNRIFGGLATRPVTDGELMFVASLDQSLYAFAPTGASQVWRYRTAAPLRSQPTVVGNRVICAIPGQGLTAFETGTGKIAWTNKDVQGTVVAVNKKRLVVWDGAAISLLDGTRGDTLERAEFPNIAMLHADKFEDGNLFVVSKSDVVARFLPK